MRNLVSSQCRQIFKATSLGTLILFSTACSVQSSNDSASRLSAPIIGEPDGSSGGGSSNLPGGGSGGSSGGSGGAAGGEPVKMAPIDVNLYPVERVICDPFGNGTDTRSNAGIKAELYYITGSERYTRAVDYINNGYKSSQNIFLSQLFVPTRRFDTGFASEAGEAIKDDNGGLLYEWFAMRFRSVLKLAANEEEGLYQFATLSDDGSVMKIRRANGQWETVADNDGDHATKMGCSAGAIEFKRNSEHVMELDYYQGPRYSISLTLLKRKVPANAPQDSSCGKQGNGEFFDTNSQPTQGYHDLLARGWAPLSKDNFSIQAGDTYNPCLNAAGPAIRDFVVDELQLQYVVLTWKTDVPATSQLIVVDPLTGKSNTTKSDNILRTQHRITLEVNPDYLYHVRAVSVGENLGRTISEPLSIRTAGVNL